MSRDLQLKVQLNAEEYVAFKAICDEEGTSQSGQARILIKQFIRTYVESSLRCGTTSTDETGQT